MDLVAQIKAAHGGPGKLAMGDTAAVKTQHKKCVVLALGLLAVNERIAPGHHFHDAVVFAEKVPRRRDAVAAEVVESAAAGLFDVPEVRAVRPAM